MKWILFSLIYRLIYVPAIFFSRWALWWLPPVVSRVLFEKKNGKDLQSQSFSEIVGMKADLCFEFSSEGEYQQVASLIEDALRAGKKLELVFFSPSVEKTIVDLAHNYSTQIRYLRFPLLTFGFSNWATAETLVLVRYDFFPSILVWCLKPGRKLKLVWVTFKKERIKKRSVSILKKLFLAESVETIYASEQDAVEGKRLGFSGSVYDFRMEQIKRRVEKREDKFKHHFHTYGDFKRKLDEYPRHKRLIIGNAWPVDMELLDKVPNDVVIVVVPHQLKPEIIDKIKFALTTRGRIAQVITEGTRAIDPSKTFIINQKGVLCELYADFGKAYVGGGFGESVHSLLEPLVAGSENISCGPNNFRSTEFDLATSYGSMTEIKNAQEFLTWLNHTPQEGVMHAKLEEQIKRYPDFRKGILAC